MSSACAALGLDASDCEAAPDLTKSDKEAGLPPDIFGDFFLLKEKPLHSILLVTAKLAAIKAVAVAVFKICLVGMILGSLLGYCG